MNYYALISGGVVANIVRMDSAPVVNGYTVVDVTGQDVRPGYLYAAGVFTPAFAPEVTNHAAMMAALEADLSALRTLAQTSGTLTAANLSNGLRLVARNVGRTARLVLGRLDTAD